jgi:sugar lactone lactonase YvrE
MKAPINYITLFSYHLYVVSLCFITLLSCQKELYFDPGANPTIPFNDTITTLAGNGIPGFADGNSSAAQFNLPEGVATDAFGNVYVADFGNHRIRKITTDGMVSTLAGNGIRGFSDGNGNTAKFNYPQGVATDAAGNVYVADYENHSIRKITSTGIVSTLAGNGIAGFADGNNSFAQFNHPRGVATDEQGNVYVVDSQNQRVRKISPTGIVSTIAGNGSIGSADGIGNIAQFRYPRGIAIDIRGNIYVADCENQKIRKISSGIVSTLAGNGIAGYYDGDSNTAEFNFPRGIAADLQGNIYVGDCENHRIRKITSTGVVSTLAGNGVAGFADGDANSAEFNFPRGLAFFDGALYIADQENSRIRKLNLK